MLFRKPSVATSGHGKKRRRFPRVQLKPRKWVAVRGAGHTNTHRCPVMGLGGMFLQCSDPLPLGSVMRFAFQIRGHIVRGIASVRDISTRGMGLAFLSLRIEDRARVYAFLKNQTAKPKKPKYCP